MTRPCYLIAILCGIRPDEAVAVAAAAWPARITAPRACALGAALRTKPPIPALGVIDVPDFATCSRRPRRLRSRLAPVRARSPHGRDQGPRRARAAGPRPRLRGRLSVLRALVLSAVLAGAADAGTVRTGLQVSSAALGAPLDYALYLPEGYGGPREQRYPVLYLLHGHGADHRYWLDRIGIAATLDALIAAAEIRPLVVVMPDGGTSWYVDSAARGGPGDHATAIARDLVDNVDATVTTVAERAGRAVAGLSMGGFGALHLAFDRPERFGAVVALSPAVFVPGGLSWQRWSLGRTEEERARWFQGAFGVPFDATVYRELHPLARLDERGGAPRVLLAAGDDDGFGFELGTVELFLALRRRAAPVELRLDDGGHDRVYWRSVVPEMLRFIDAGWPAP